MKKRYLVHFVNTEHLRQGGRHDNSASMHTAHCACIERIPVAMRLSSHKMRLASALCCLCTAQLHIPEPAGGPIPHSTVREANTDSNDISQEQLQD